MRDAVTQNRRRKERAKLWIILRNGDGGDMLHDQWQRQLSQTRTIFFDDMTRHRRQNLAGDDQATLLVD